MKQNHSYALLIAGGSIGSPVFYAPLVKQADFILCADSGYDNAKKIGAVPNLVIGDFDSVDALPPNTIPRETLPCEKDRTDSQACLEYLLDKGYKHINIIGGIGTRLDHTLANIYMLYSGLVRGADCRLIDEHNEIMLTDGSLRIPRRNGYRLSLLPIGTAEGISTAGLYYPLSNGKMGLDYPCGVSNEFIADTAEIRLEHGLLLVMLCRD